MKKKKEGQGGCPASHPSRYEREKKKKLCTKPTNKSWHKRGTLFALVALVLLLLGGEERERGGGKVFAAPS